MILVCKAVVSSRTSTKVAINKRMSDHIYIIGMNSNKQMVGTTLHSQGTEKQSQRGDHIGRLCRIDLWKERNQRVFECKEKTPLALVGLIKQDVRMLAQAMRGATTLGE